MGAVHCLNGSARGWIRLRVRKAKLALFKNCLHKLEATFVCNCLGKISMDTPKKTKIFPRQSSYSFAEIAETLKKKVKLSTYRWYTPASLDHKKSSQNYNVIAASAKCQQGLRRENDDSTSLSLPTMLVHIPEATPFLALFWREVFSATRVFPTPQNQTFPKIK